MSTPVYRLLNVLGQIAYQVPEIEHLESMLSKERLHKMKELYEGKVWNQKYYQTAAHIVTGGASLGVGAHAVYNKYDAASAINITTKFGEAGSTWLRGSETWFDGELREVEHKLNKGSEAGKRFTEMFQQYMRILQDLSQNTSRARLGS